MAASIFSFVPESTISDVLGNLQAPADVYGLHVGGYCGFDGLSGSKLLLQGVQADRRRDARSVSGLMRAHRKKRQKSASDAYRFFERCVML